MIRVNLLPPELRRPERTPLAKMLVLVFGVVLVILALLAFLGIQAAWLPTVRARRVEREEKLKQVEKDALEYDDLVREREKYLGRHNAVLELQRSRIMWSKKLDELIDLVPASVWLSQVQVEEPPPVVAKGARGTGPKVSLHCAAAGTNEAIIADFLDRLRTGDPEFYADFAAYEPPGWETKAEDRVEEGQALEFGIVMHMKPLSERFQPPPATADTSTARKEQLGG